MEAERERERSVVGEREGGLGAKRERDHWRERKGGLGAERET